MNTLVVDDNKEVAGLVSLLISKLPFSKTTKAVTSYESALSAHYTEHYDCYIVDVMLDSGKNGIELCKLFRKQSPNATIIVLTGFGTKNICDKAFKEHVDDFVRKPVMRDELVHRVRKARKQRIGCPNASNALDYEGLCYDLDANFFFYKEIPLNLTKGQKELLVLFIEQPNTLLSRQYLISKLWEDDISGVTKKRNLGERIYELKKGLGEPLKSWIISVWGEGYILTKKR